MNSSEKEIHKLFMTCIDVFIYIHLYSIWILICHTVIEINIIRNGKKSIYQNHPSDVEYIMIYTFFRNSFQLSISNDGIS